MSALHAYKISNLLVKCNDEVPIFDGSAEEFCRVIESVGIEEQGGEWFEIAPSQPIEIQIESKKGEQISLLPCDHFCVAYELDYPQPVGVQRFEFHFRTIEDYRKEIASARTFGFMRDIEKLQRAGLAAGGRLDNFVLFGDNGIINTKLRFDNEPARHKILDIVGDLFLVGRPLRCKVVARMTGHADNVSVLKAVAPLAVV
jgi:UDP-3-O-acyl N-acetylglucosamine deacetylase